MAKSKLSPLIQKNLDMEFHWINDSDDDYEDDDIPEGCRACGGDYPNCTEGCPLFDD